MRMVQAVLGVLFLAGVGATAVKAAEPPVRLTALKLPGAPFGIALSPDDRWAFVSMARSGPAADRGLAILHRENDRWSLKRTLDLSSDGCHCEVTHDGKNLLIAAIDRVIVYDVAALESGSRAKPVGVIEVGEAEITYLTTSRDDRTLFVAEESKARVSVGFVA